jgi:hypothetical protein
MPDAAAYTETDLSRTRARYTTSSKAPEAIVAPTHACPRATMCYGGYAVAVMVLVGLIQYERKLPALPTASTTPSIRVPLDAAVVFRGRAISELEDAADSRRAGAQCPEGTAIERRPSAPPLGRSR